MIRRIVIARHSLLPIIYAYGLGSLFLSDLFVSTFFNVEEVASWARQKSAFMICMAAGLGGLDTLLFRRPYLKARLSVILVVLSLGAAVLVPSYFLTPDQGLSRLLFIAVVPAATLAAFWATDARARGRIFVGQAWWCSWRGMILPGVAAAALLGRGLVLPLILLPLIPLVVWKSATLRTLAAGFGDLSVKSMRKLTILLRASLPLTVALVSLAVAYNFEILLLSKHAGNEEVRQAFVLIAFLGAPAQAITSFLAFIALPMLRQGRSIFSTAPRRGLILALPAALLISVAAVGVGTVAMVLVGHQQMLGWPAVAWAVAVGVARMMYIWPSGYFGVFASEGQLWRSVVLGLLCQAIGLALFFAALLLGLEVVSSALLAGAAAWVCRTWVGYWQMMPSIMRRAKPALTDSRI